jgi:hypothetical protein
MIPRGATVMMQVLTEYSGLFVEMARRLRDELDCVVHLYVAVDRDVRHYSAMDGGKLFASVTIATQLMDAARSAISSAEDVLAAASANESWLGLTYNELCVTNRHLGRGFALGGFNFPRSRLSEETDYLGMLHGHNREIAFWRGEFEAKRPALAINLNKVGCVVARRLGVPLRWLAISRYRNFHYWAFNEFYESPRLRRAYDRTPMSNTVEIAEPYDAHMQLRAVFQRETSLARTLAVVGRMILQRLYWRVRGYQKGKNYYLRSEVASILARRRDLLRTTGRHAASLEALKGKRYVFFPLHTEPETALQGLSPEYFYQLSCIAAIARDLPAGVLLAVKDTYFSLGFRPHDFYDQIREFKNVVLLDTMILGPTVIRGAEAVVTITGTGGFEAAVQGKPVVLFGRHNIYDFLPHVHVIRDEAELKPALAACLSPRFDALHARAEGARFLAALLSESFDLADFSTLKRGSMSPAAADAAYRSMMRTLSRDLEHEKIPA